MAQNNNILIGIVLVIILGAGLYLYLQSNSNTPTNPNNPSNPTTTNFSAEATQMYQLLSSANVASSTNYIDYAALFGATTASLVSVEQALNAKTYATNTPEAQLRSILLTAVSATKSHNAGIDFANQIDAIPSSQYCNNLSLFNSRDQKFLETVQSLTQLKTQLQSFETNYPTESDAISLHASDLDFSAFQQSEESIVASTTQLKQSCEGTA